jgi:probable F420-dependent oxidoreductase
MPNTDANPDTSNIAQEPGEASAAELPWVTGRYAVWLGLGALPGDPGELRKLATEIEGLGFSALWLGGSWGADLAVPKALLEGSDRLVVGTSISNIWRDPAERVAESYTALAAEYGARFVLGVGPGHAAQVDLHQDRYARPLAALGEFLDVLDAARPPVPLDRRALSALGPKALRLAADRSAGALPYFTTPEHTRTAREALGGKFLAPEQKLVLDADPDRARATARWALKYYLALPNYVNSWRRLGFTDSDFETGGSDRLIDALFGWGSPEAALARVREHLAAGADQVCIQPIPARGGTPIDDLRVIAHELGLSES